MQEMLPLRAAMQSHRVSAVGEAEVGLDGDCDEAKKSAAEKDDHSRGVERADDAVRESDGDHEEADAYKRAEHEEDEDGKAQSHGVALSCDRVCRSEEDSHREVELDETGGRE